MRNPRSFFFEEVEGDELKTFKEAYAKIVKPLCGAEATVKSLQAILDDEAKILFARVGDDPAGVIVYDKDLVTDKENKLERSLQIRAFFLCDPEKQSAKGQGSMMVRHLFQLAECHFEAPSLHFSVEKDWTQLVKFLKKWGFQEQSCEGEGTKLLLVRQTRADTRPSQPVRKRTREDERTTTTSVKRPWEDEKTTTTSAKRPRFTGTDHGNVPLMRKYLEQIRRGEKTVEGRIYSGQFRRYREGDTVTWINQDQRVPCLITGVKVYWSFREMLENEGVRNCLADVWDVETAVNIYHNIPNFEHRAMQSGVLAIRLERT